MVRNRSRAEIGVRNWVLGVRECLTLTTYSIIPNPFFVLGLWSFVPIILLLIGCSSSPPAEPAIAANRKPDEVVVAKHAVASVLIVSGPDQSVPKLKSIRVSPGLVVADRGEVVELSARALDEDGQPIDGVELVWAVADPRAGAMIGPGTFRAGAVPGEYREAISVTGIHNTPRGIEYVSASTSVTIVGETAASRLTSVAVLPENVTVLPDQIYRLRAVGFDQDGLVIPGVSFAWRVTNPALGHVNSIGYLTVKGEPGLYAGALVLTGDWEGVSVTTTTDVTVAQTPPAKDFLDVQALPQRFHLAQGGRLQLRAVALNGAGDLVSGAELRWSMVDPRAGSVDGDGLFVAGDVPGIYAEAVRVEAVISGQQGPVRAVDFASVVISQERAVRKLDAVKVFPESLVVAPRGRALLVVQAVDSFGNPIDKVGVSWEAANPAVGEIDSLGNFTASGGPGRYSGALRVTVGQELDNETVVRSKSVDVIITGVLAHLEIHPQQATIEPGRTVHFSVTAHDENGIPLTGLVVRWSVSHKEIGTIDAFGNFTAGANPGLYQDAIKAEATQRLPGEQ